MPYSLFASLLLITALYSPGSNADQRPLLSLVMDDLGYSFQLGKEAIELTGDHTYAIIPGTSYGKKLASLADIHKKEVILHLPLQASNPVIPSEPNVLDETMTESQLSNNLISMLDEFSVIKGVNNHMGSHLTQFDYFMRPIMDSIKAYNPNFYFLDSRTSPKSIAYTEAVNSGLHSISRDIFLDNEHDNPESIHLQFQIWLQKARTQGHAVAIGHPHSTTIAYLQENLTETMEKFQFLSVSKLLNERISANLKAENLQVKVSSKPGLIPTPVQ